MEPTNCLAQLSRFLFTHARRVDGGSAPNADGRPLYAYRCSARAYDELRTQVASQLEQAILGQTPPGFAACFCLYASETFHREHSGGAWAWKTVFDPLGSPVPANPVIGRWVEDGLAYWKRPILKGGQGHRLWLVTIACEGGLPLRLLQREGTHLRSFFRQILEDYHAASGLAEDLETLVRRHVHRLPQSLRNEEVVRLAAALIGRTVKLQSAINDSSDPIAALDDQVPHWRSTLPLRLDDGVASALFKNLVEDSREIALAAAAKPTWKGFLVELTPRHFVVRKTLRFPEVVPQEQVSAWMGYQDADPRARLRLYLNSLHRTEPVAILTLFARSGGRPVYRREWLRPGGVSLKGPEVLEPQEVRLGDGVEERHLELQDSAEWGECPWIFVPANKDRKWAWLSEGSGSTRKEQAMVVTPETCTPEPSEAGSVEHVGNAAELDRIVYRVSGTVDFKTEDGDRYRIQCGAAEDSAGSLRLRGEVLPLALNSQPVFLGIPRFQEDRGARAISRSAGVMEWRPYGQEGTWRTVTEECVGRVWLRLSDAEAGVERIRRRADIVPSGLAVERQIGSQQRAGEYTIRGCAAAEVEVLEPETVTANKSLREDKALLECPPIEAESLVPLAVQLRWPGAAPVALQMPYPQKGAMFQLDGRTLPLDELVTLDRLYGAWAILQNPSGGERFILDAELAGKYRASRLGFTEQLPPLQQGGLQCNLGVWVDQIQSMLAATDDLEATVTLAVKSQARKDLARIRVARFDMVMCPVRDDDSVLVPADQLEKLGEDWPTRISIGMFPLWSPNETPIPLKPREDVSGAWQVPNELEPGPWWVVGRDGDWARFRPLLWSVARTSEDREEAVDASGLAAAVRETDSEERSGRIDTVIREMGVQPDHSDWELLLSYVALAKEFPPNSLDVLRHLIHHPRTLALALLLSDEAQFERLIGFAEQMPFAWGLLPVRAWRHAAHVYFDHLRKALANLETSEDILWNIFESFRSRAAAARPYFDPLCDWLQELEFPDRRLTNSSLSLARLLPMKMYLDHVIAEERELLSRHDTDEQWPQGPEVIELADNGTIREEFRYGELTFQRPVRCAPFVAASIALGAYDDALPRARLVYELRTLRGFDSDWFDKAYALGLALGLAHYAAEESE